MHEIADFKHSFNRVLRNLEVGEESRPCLHLLGNGFFNHRDTEDVANHFS